MFVIDASSSYLFPVKVAVRSEDGSVKTHEFHLRFARKSSEEADALVKRIEEEHLSDPQIAREVVVGFGDDVFLKGNQPAEFSAELLDKMLAIHPAPAAIVTAFFASLKTEIKEEAAAKN